ncbi:MAG: ABC transporter permease [Nocardioides sp.]|uniref:ABC transporter permease n=1 Tax=Nocardioides sp. TaxID=35761 RepID=UPI0039E2978E
MLAYIIRRVVVGAVMLVVMSLVTFLLFFASPIDPARYACGKNCSQELKAAVTKQLGYDEPVTTQWSGFMAGLVVGRDFPLDKKLRESHPEQIVHCPAPCLGYSSYSKKTVNDMVTRALPVTISLSIYAFLLWITAGVLIGIVAALRKGSLVDRLIVGASLVAYAFPVFFVGSFLLRFVAIKWGLWEVPSYSPFFANPGSFLYNMFFPALTLALLFMAGYVRVTRSFVIESMSEDYIRTARAKGLKGRIIVRKHALRAALTPLVTMAGIDFAGLLAGAIITETVFNINGLGRMAVYANQNYDLPVLVALVLASGFFLITANIIVDILYAYIDPRVRMGK